MKKVIYYFFLVCFLVLLVEGGSFVGVLYLESKMAIYRPRETSPSSYDNYLKQRDPVLGWPSPKEFGGPYYDKSGARRSPAYPGAQKSLSYISAYGDSFTYGAEVGEASAYPNVLASLLEKKVSNFGVGGYGTDQAYLRFLNNAGDPAEIVILGYATENIVRNVNRYVDLRFPVTFQNFGFKPRFVRLPDGSLKLIPLPKFSYEEFRRAIRSPREIQYEYFIPGSCPEVGLHKFPFTLTLLKALFGKPSFKAKLRRDWYLDFYAPGHAPGALAVTFGIMKSFHRNVLSAGKRPIIFIIPLYSDLLSYEKNKTWPYADLSFLLKKSGMEFIDAGPAIMRKLGGGDLGKLFAPHKHYNTAGNKMLAEIVRDYLGGAVHP